MVATDIFGRGIDVERVNIVINYDCPPDADSYLHRVGYVLITLTFYVCLHRIPSRAGRFGTKGLAITFVASDSDQQVMAAIQSRFEVAVPELPDHIDPASYSKLSINSYTMMLMVLCSDIVINSPCISCRTRLTSLKLALKHLKYCIFSWCEMTSIKQTYSSTSYTYQWKFLSTNYKYIGWSVIHF